MPASRVPEQVSQLGDKRRAVEPLVSTRGMLGEGGIFTRSEVGEAGRGLVKTREGALHRRLHLLEAPLCVGANFAPKAPLRVGANIAILGSSTRRRQLRSESSSTRWRQLRTKSPSMRRRKPSSKSSYTRRRQPRKRVGANFTPGTPGCVGANSVRIDANSMVWSFSIRVFPLELLFSGGELAPANHEEPAIQDQLELRVDLFEEELHVLVIGSVAHQQDVVLAGDGCMYRFRRGLYGEGDVEGA